MSRLADVAEVDGPVTKEASATSLVLLVDMALRDVLGHWQKHQEVLQMLYLILVDGRQGTTGGTSRRVVVVGGDGSSLLD